MTKVSVFAVLLVCCWAKPSLAEDLAGYGESLVDGDEFILCQSADSCRNIRLCGINTPSKGSEGHAASLDALGKLVLGQPVLCRPVGEGSVCDGLAARESAGRIVAQCFVVGATVDVAAELVSGGFACDRVEQSNGYYSKDLPDRQCPP
jgi:endonuclease YncB( thermonuclease family)